MPDDAVQCAPAPWTAPLAVAHDCNSAGTDSHLYQASANSLDALTPQISALASNDNINAFDPGAQYRFSAVCSGKTELDEAIAGGLRWCCSPETESPGRYCYAGMRDPAEAGKVAILMPGQGYPGLEGCYPDKLLELCRQFPAMAEAFDRSCDLTGHPLRTYIFPDPNLPPEERYALRHHLAARRLDEFGANDLPDETLPFLGVFAANWANWLLVNELGIPVDMLFGPSHGELSALCAAGAMRFEEVIAGQSRCAFPPPPVEDVGQLLFVLGSQDAVAGMLSEFPKIETAIAIAPNHCLLGGTRTDILACAARFGAQRIQTRELHYPAAHTSFCSFFRAELESHLSAATVTAPDIPTYSGAGAGLYPHDPERIRQMLMDNFDHTLQMWQTFRLMYEDGARIFIQAGGGATMHRRVRPALRGTTSLNGSDVTAISLYSDQRSGINQLLHICAQLSVLGFPLRLDSLAH